VALHDETAAFAAATERARVERALAFVTAFKAVALEGLEVIFIVIAVGSVGDLLVPASLGAGLALLMVVALAVVLHRPLAQVPENALKFTVGVMLASFGTFWTGEGLGLRWPNGDWAILILVAGWGSLAFVLIQLVRPADAMEKRS
jgi:Ca2+/H+ antiporter, TMEM165/GDT1 family